MALRAPAAGPGPGRELRSEFTDGEVGVDEELAERAAMVQVPLGLEPEYFAVDGADDTFTDEDLRRATRLELIAACEARELVARGKRADMVEVSGAACDHSVAPRGSSP